MARRIPIALVALLLLQADGAPAQTDSPSALVRYSFDDNTVDTGPDTFAVFQNARGSVRLSASNSFSGYRSIEVREEADDSDFPELQGYFPLRTRGKLFLHFALMTPKPAEEFNIALAGPEWFALRRNGIGFWLKTLDGYLCHYSDSIPRKLVAIQPFAWYVIDAVYDIDRGTYDLTIHEQGQSEPIVSLKGQPNAPNQPGSAVDKFSFIGDTGSDQSNAVYYVDDVVVSVDEALTPSPFAAPGRKKLFIDYWTQHQREIRSQPSPLPAIDFSDFGMLPKDVQALQEGGLWDLLQQALEGRPQPIPEGASLENRRFIEAAILWTEATAALRNGKAEIALDRFERALQWVPAGRIYELNAVLSLAALGQWQQVDTRLVKIYPEWSNDIRFPAAIAMIGIARQDLARAEEWLRNPAEQTPDVLGQELLERLGSNQIDEALAEALRKRFPDNWQDYIRDKLIADQYFYVLLWQKQTILAERFAERMVDRYRTLGIRPSAWIEKLGDAAFLREDFGAALRRYEESLGATGDRPEPRILQKISDVYFRFGDFAKERLYREKVYGRLDAAH